MHGVYLGSPRSAYAFMFGLLAAISWGLHYRYAGDLRMLFVGGTIVFGGLALIWLLSSFFAGGSGTRSPDVASGMILLGGLILGGSLLAAMFGKRGSQGSELPGVAELVSFGRGLSWLGYGLFALFGMIALWPASRCPACSSSPCRCYDGQR